MKLMAFSLVLFEALAGKRLPLCKPHCSTSSSASLFSFCSSVPDDLDSLKGLESNIWVAIVASTLQVIAGEDGSRPIELPANVAAKHRAAAGLGKKIKARQQSMQHY
jgi:hypothetical protein